MTALGWRWWGGSGDAGGRRQHLGAADVGGDVASSFKCAHSASNRRHASCMQPRTKRRSKLQHQPSPTTNQRRRRQHAAQPDCIVPRPMYHIFRDYHFNRVVTPHTYTARRSGRIVLMMSQLTSNPPSNASGWIHQSHPYDSIDVERRNIDSLS